MMRFVGVITPVVVGVTRRRRRRLSWSEATDVCQGTEEEDGRKGESMEVYIHG